MIVLGIDVSKDKLDVHLLTETGHEVARFANHKRGWRGLGNWLKKRSKKQPVHVCLEATGRYGEGVTEFLHGLGHAVYVVNPARIKAYAQALMTRNKTDVTDAAVIADFCRTQHSHLTLWTPPDPSQRRLQALIRHLEDLQQMRQQERNRLQAGEHDADVLQRINTHIAFLDDQIQQVKQAIDDHIDQHPDLGNKRHLLASITGIGNLTACKLLAEIPNIHAFHSPRQLVAFSGLNPRHRQSGSSIRGKTRISKIGSASLRAALYMPAVVAKNHNPILVAFAQRLAQRGLTKLQIIVAVMRKLLHLVFGILKSGQPFDPNYLDKLALNP